MSSSSFEFSFLKSLVSLENGLFFGEFDGELNGESPGEVSGEMLSFEGGANASSFTIFCSSIASAVLALALCFGLAAISDMTSRLMFLLSIGGLDPAWVCCGGLLITMGGGDTAGGVVEGEVPDELELAGSSTSDSYIGGSVLDVVDVGVGGLGILARIGLAVDSTVGKNFGTEGASDKKVTGSA